MIISELIAVIVIMLPVIGVYDVYRVYLFILVSCLTYETLVRLLQVNFQAWASISLVIDVVVAGAMIWSVRD